MVMAIGICADDGREMDLDVNDMNDLVATLRYAAVSPAALIAILQAHMVRPPVAA